MDSGVADIRKIVDAAAVPMAIVDYSPVVARFSHLTADQVRRRLADQDELLACLRILVVQAASDEWLALYGSPMSEEAPNLPARQFSPEQYPDLTESMILQLTAPIRGATTIVREHLAPTLTGDVVVRSHWKASILSGTPDYSRIVIIDHDITDLRAARDEVEKALEAKDRLVATIAHELRNSVTTMVGFSSLLHDDWYEFDDEGRLEIAATLQSQAADAAGLLEDLITDTIGGDIWVADDDLLVEEVLAGLDLDGVQSHLEPDLVVAGDPLRIRQIVRNLVGNARRHGGPDIGLRAFPLNARVCIVVTDNGPGLVEDLEERLFQPLAHGGSSGSIGLGLSVARRLARAMGGDLAFRRDGDETVFTLELRRVEASEGGSSPPLEGEVLASAGGGGTPPGV